MMPTENAAKYLRDLVAGKVIPAGALADRVPLLLADLAAGVDFVDEASGSDLKDRVSRAIDLLKPLPWKPREGGTAPGCDITEPGVFIWPPGGEGKPYVVRWTRKSGGGGGGRHLYACELVELSGGEGDRSDELGGRVRFKHVFDRDARMMSKLRECHRVTGVALEELMNRYSQCVMCGITLKLWTSQNQLDPEGNRVQMGDTCYANAYGVRPDHKASKAAAAAGVAA